MTDIEIDDALISALIRHAAIDGLVVKAQHEQSGIAMDLLDGRVDRVKTRQENLKAINAAMERVILWETKV
jgi:hypothetical protein